MDFESIMIDKLGIPFNELKLNEYINFVLMNVKHINEEGCIYEKHHLLPSSLFNEYIKDSENIYNLLYEDHVKAHILLSDAYPIKQFLRPLNFMLHKSEQDQKEFRQKLSIATKKSWVNFKLSPNYKHWQEKRSLFMKKWCLEVGFSDLSIKRNKERFKDINERNKVGKQFKDLWKDEEYRNRTIKSMIIERNTPEAKERISKATQKVWDNKSDIERDLFKEKMKSINQDEDKRKDASIKIKEKWQDSDFKAKMKNRKIGDSKKKSEGMKKRWTDPEYRERMKLRKTKAKNKPKIKDVL